MKPASFGYHRPASVAEALELLARHGPEAKVIAGGQSLVPMMNMRLAAPAHLVDINDLSELSRIRVSGDRLEVGALARHAAIAASELAARHCPLLVQATRTIGHQAIRERGTVGGSLVHADPAAQHALVAVTLGARLRLVRQGGERIVDAAQFLLAPMTTAIGADEMLVSVSYPVAAPHEVSAFRMFNQRRGDFAVAAVAACLRVRDGRAERLALGVGGTGPVPQRLDDLARAFEGRRVSPDWVAEAARAARESLQPEEHPRVPAVFRQELTQHLVARALARCAQEAGAPA